MLQVVYCWSVAILLLANSVNTPVFALQVLDTVVAVYFVAIGAIAGWLAARD